MFVTNPATIPNFFPAAQMVEMDSVKLEVLCPNPKRPGTKAHAHFELMVQVSNAGGTVADYLALGGKFGRIGWNAERGYLRLTNLVKVAPSGALI